MSPRTTTGETLRLLDGEADAFVLDLTTDRDLGDRHVTGRLWIAMRPGKVDLLFHADDTDEGFGSTFAVKRAGGRVVVGLRLDGEVVAHIGAPQPVRAGDEYRVTWGSAFDLMA